MGALLSSYATKWKFRFYSAFNGGGWTNARPRFYVADQKKFAPRPESAHIQRHLLSARWKWLWAVDKSTTIYCGRPIWKFAAKKQGNKNGTTSHKMRDVLLNDASPIRPDLCTHPHRHPPECNGNLTFLNGRHVEWLNLILVKVNEIKYSAGGSGGIFGQIELFLEKFVFSIFTMWQRRVSSPHL